MAQLFNLVRMSTATTGTGTITLGSAVTGFLTFAGGGAVDGSVVSYGIQDGANSEVGSGTYTASGTTLTRTVTNSTNAGSAINLSGSAQVFITALAADFAQMTTTSGNAVYQILATDKVVATTTTAMSAGRIWTLCAASALNAGRGLLIIDLNGVTGTQTLSIARAGSDTINGASTSLTIATAYSGWLLTSDGSSKWNAVYLPPGYTGSGNVVLATSAALTSPVLTTPNIGVATATSVNKVVFTAPATAATVTVANAKVLTQNNTLTYSGTDGSTVAFGAGGTVLYSGSSTLSSKLISLTRAPGTSSGSVSYTGVGFTPTSIIFFGAPGGTTNVGFIGLVDSARSGASLYDLGAPTIAVAAVAVGAVGALQSATVSSYDADGFTLAWTKTGSPGGADYTIYALCFR